jgi:GNAT superfamily N-acetyltransferase
MVIEMQIVLRPARPEDRARVIEVEAGATLNLQYLPKVFDMFASDPQGEFGVVEVDGTVVACGKLTVVPDGSAWLEALRVMPAYQGLGIGKRFYERFFELARLKGVTTMRMYTGLRNVVSKGLAERFGFHLAATYRGAYLPVAGAPGPQQTAPATTVSRTMPTAAGFRQVRDAGRATDLLMSLKERWAGFLVMNRTFYEVTPALSAWLAGRGAVYENPATGSFVTLDARFMPEQSLHIGVFNGPVEEWLPLAVEKAAAQGAARLQCMFPPTAEDVQAALQAQRFMLEPSDCIVMEVRI